MPVVVTVLTAVRFPPETATDVRPIVPDVFVAVSVPPDTVSSDTDTAPEVLVSVETPEDVVAEAPVPVTLSVPPLTLVTVPPDKVS